MNMYALDIFLHALFVVKVIRKGNAEFVLKSCFLTYGFCTGICYFRKKEGINIR